MLFLLPYSPFRTQEPFLAKFIKDNTRKEYFLPYSTPYPYPHPLDHRSRRDPMPRRGDSPGHGRPAHEDPRSPNLHSTDDDDDIYTVDWFLNNLGVPYSDFESGGESDESDESGRSHYPPHME